MIIEREESKKDRLREGGDRQYNRGERERERDSDIGSKNVIQVYLEEGAHIDARQL